MRIGLGYDIHRLVKARKLFLGGVQIPFQKGLLGHSDADVLLHAVCDALLGAIGEKDIGYHFPNAEQKYKDISSLGLLRQVGKILKKKGYKVNNIDLVVIAEKPKIIEYIDQMKKNIAGVLTISVNTVGIKATTNEGIGDIGRAKAIAAYAVVSVENSKF
ncbi:MAG: 2-C-methyl-D-erythritol 2,4-cyclodiphosphate synthase [Elusimicrobia bacterium]|nr:2-C-methyl-D-erythritol 2,4-cyclodiphosphate synthase [Elusimicrobiota bacterium]